MQNRIRRWVAVVCLSLTVLVVGAPALADGHDPKRSGHPLRLVAYLLHPVGVVIDTLVARPAHWFIHVEPLKTLFGHED